MSDTPRPIRGTHPSLSDTERREDYDDLTRGRPSMPVRADGSPVREYTRTDRGFQRAQVIAGIPGHGNVQVYESSLATQPAIWMQIDEATDGSATTQLSIEAAKALRDDLDHLIHTHYQLVDGG